ncbi:hypothetical protein GLOTRDRAFT_91328 [Gloeophyllum trabeum ATCC 11539]|uniref:Uncharacterized protein n=1 Tax=Gloeophyllum trabeum (strain ATCC 11539 / FP-39264 / Madison 617) TaxID=670483 RepID=S7QKF0_GLOTA|nr:uncharacterized protein GLOTRDRAFT_91328 [Gloeophyllum trabeum ATCC 11539]EPQ59862.1 hypothetical protein GLOTRDRAFT_91328 [Gloeophyllum trabeum ATCC 11539]
MVAGDRIQEWCETKSAGGSEGSKTWPPPFRITSTVRGDSAERTRARDIDAGVAWFPVVHLVLSDDAQGAYMLRLTWLVDDLESGEKRILAFAPDEARKQVDPLQLLPKVLPQLRFGQGRDNDAAQSTGDRMYRGGLRLAECAEKAGLRLDQGGTISYIRSRCLANALSAAVDEDMEIA